jgi:O-antigen ligase
MESHNTMQKLFYFFPVLLCFCLPFGTLLLSAIVVLWGITSFFNIRKADLAAGLRHPALWLSWAFFLATVVSAAFSENRDEALFSIEVKMSFLVFPYFFFCFSWPLGILKRMVVAFVSGCFFACLYLIARALFYTAQGQPEYLFYTLFSDFIHASYFSMYLLMALAFVVLLYHKWFAQERAVIYSSWFFIAIFIAGIFLCASKLGLISFFICSPLLILYKWRATWNLRKLSVLLVGLGLALLLSTFLFPSAFSRMGSLSSVGSENIDKTSVESTAVRWLIWKESLSLIGDHFLFGTGVGDANDMLYQSYAREGLSGAYNHRLNAHNQYFQTFVGMGVFGFLLLLGLTFGQLIIAFLRRHFLLFFFSLVVMLNFLVESMLQRSAGVLFFAFFYCFFSLVDEERLNDETHIP